MRDLQEDNVMISDEYEENISPVNIVQEENTGTDEENGYGVCPECGRPLKVTATRRGPMLGCTGYPLCHYMAPITVRQTVKIERILENCRCPECGHPLAVKSGRYGQFVSCSNYPECHYVYKNSGNDDIVCPMCSRGTIQVRKTRYNKVFWGCSGYPECEFHTSYKPVRKKCPYCGCEVALQKKSKNGYRYICATCEKHLD